jgi:hypothetical protein
MNMNLDGLTCIKKFDVPLQVTIMTWFIHQRKDLNSKLNFKPRYTVEALSNTVVAIVTLGVLQPSPLKEILTRDLKRRKVLQRIMNNHTSLRQFEHWMLRTEEIPTFPCCFFF